MQSELIPYRCSYS